MIKIGRFWSKSAIFGVMRGQIIVADLTLEHFNGKMSRDFREVKNHKNILYA